MHHMANENQIILALDLAHLSPADQLSALKKIISDGLVQKRSLEMAVNQYIVRAVESLLPIEKAALIKRVGAGDPPRNTAHVSWFVEVGLQSGRLHIRATCPHLRSWWDCAPTQLGAAKHCNEPLPNNIREEYTRRWAPPTTVGDDMARLYAVAQQARPVTLDELRERAARHEENA
jgi:hypothetical protein